MSENPPTLFNTLVDYEQNANLDIEMVSAYQVMNQIAELNFDIDKKTISDILTNWKFVIPEYQRLFSWKKKQHRQIWSEIQMFIDAELRNGQDNVSDVFFGSMYFAVKKNGATLEVIDGQQRLTSIYIILRAILEELTQIQNSAEIDDTQIENLCENGVNQIREILYETTTFGGREATLSLNKHDNDFFDALIRGDEAQLDYLLSDDRKYIDGRKTEAHEISSLIDDFDIDDKRVDEANPDEAVLSEYISVYESNKNLLTAYEYYRCKVAELVEQANDAKQKVISLINVSKYIQESYYLGRFEIRNAEPEFRMQVFEILNDRGLELTKIDRIRANVVNTFFDEADRDEYIEKWENIVTSFGTDSDKIEKYLSVYLSVIEKEVSSTADASSELLNAFSTRNIESSITPQFETLGQARPFLNKAEEFVSYYKDISKPNLEESELEISTDYQNQCREVLIRLNDLSTTQWHPLILYTYHYTVNEPSGDAKQFYKLLEATEKLNIRRLLVGSNPNIFENIFVRAAHEFKNKAESSSEDPYTQTRNYMIETMQSNASQLFSDELVDRLSQADSWNENYAKLIFEKISNQKFRDSPGAVDREVNLKNTHLEHILPQDLIWGSGDDTWPREFFKLDRESMNIGQEVESYISLINKEQDDEAELSDEQIQRKEEIKSFLQQRFINDIGNYLLLNASDNISASNRPLSEKIPRYYNDSDDFTGIHVNRYLTTENEDLDRKKLNRILSQAEKVDSVNRESIDDELKSYFDGFWTVNKLKQRRVQLILDILEILSFKELDDEFGLRTECKQVEERVRQQTEEEFEKRLSMRSL
jgi:uncharacterized protein with ParB-like and HNH nuclease domain